MTAGSRGALSRFLAADGFFMSAGLAFFFLVSLIPILLLGVSLVGFVLSGEEAARQVGQRQGKIVNVDATLIAQQPKVDLHIVEMKKRIAAALGVSEKQIGVKATTSERLGFTGRGEGIAALATATVRLPWSGT